MDLQVEYDNRARVPENPAIIAGWHRDAAAFRAAWPEPSWASPMAPGERERLDLFRPGPGEAWPVALFMHGGYWQALDRSFFSHTGARAAGAGRGRGHPVLRPLPAGAARRHRRPDAGGGAAAAPKDRAAPAGHRPFRRRPSGGDADGDRLARARSAPAGGAGRRPACRSPGSSSWSRCCRPPSAPGCAWRRPRRGRCRHASCPRPACRCMRWWAGRKAASSFARRGTSPRPGAARRRRLPGLNHFTILAPLAEPGSGLSRRAASMALAVG